MEEINEEFSESLDNFLLHDNPGNNFRTNALKNFRRVETEHRKLSSISSKPKLAESHKEIDAISHSENDKLQESYQQANSDLFLESQKNYPIHVIDLESLDWSDSSSSMVDESPIWNNSGNKTHDTIKALEFHSPEQKFIKFNN